MLSDHVTRRLNALSAGLTGQGLTFAETPLSAIPDSLGAPRLPKRGRCSKRPVKKFPRFVRIRGITLK